MTHSKEILPFAASHLQSVVKPYVYLHNGFLPLFLLPFPLFWPSFLVLVIIEICSQLLVSSLFLKILLNNYFLTGT